MELEIFEAKYTELEKYLFHPCTLHKQKFEFIYNKWSSRSKFYESENNVIIKTK